MICSGGKKYENVVIKRSPRKEEDQEKMELQVFLVVQSKKILTRIIMDS